MVAPALKTGTKIRILFDRAECADVRLGDIGTIVYISKPDESGSYVYDILMENNDTWSFTQKSFEYWKDKEENQVSNPSHYTKGKIQVIDFIEDQELSFRLANVIKYICRCDHKGTKESDLRKAIWYIEREISKSK